MRLREKNLANPRNPCRGFSQIRCSDLLFEKLFESLVCREPSAGHEPPVMTKNKFLELFDPGLAQADETHLRDTQIVLPPLTRHHAGNSHRLRQCGVDV